MKGLPLPSDFGGKGVLDLELLIKNKAFFTTGAESIPAFNSSYSLKKNCFLSSNNGFGEPTSVLDSTISGGNTSSSTPSSSHGGGSGGGGGASTDTAGVGAVSDADPSPISSNAGGAESDLLPVPPCLEFGANGGGIGGSPWENLFSTLPPSQEQSIFRYIMEDAGEESTVGNLNRSLQIGGGGGPSASEFDFSGGFGIVDPGDPFGPNSLSAAFSSLPNRSGAEKTDLPSDLLQPPAFYPSSELKPLVFNPNNPHQARHTQNPSFVIPLHNEQSSEGFVNGSLGPNWPYTNAHQEPQQLHHHLQLLPHYLPPQIPTKPGPNLRTGTTDEPVQIQTIITNHLYNVAELIQTGNFVLAQGILARLNHFLSPSGKPCIRAAFYCKQALESLLVTNNNIETDTNSPSDLIFKIAAYKSFSEISPLVEFSNFSRNQAFLEAFDGLDRIHIVDFDIGLGGQWASIMQELGLRAEARPTLKITALVPVRRHSQLELCLVRENLFQFAREVNVEFEFEVSSVDSFSVSGNNEAVGVNLPIYCLAEYELPLPLVLRFVKQMSPRVVVTADGGCEMTDLPFAGYVVRSLQSCSNLLESIDAVVGLDSEGVRRIERFLIGPRMERMMVGHLRRPGKLGHWRDMFASSGFLQVGFSDFAGFQGECIVKRARARGFQMEKRRPSTFVLSWMQKELVSVSVWRC